MDSKKIALVTLTLLAALAFILVGSRILPPGVDWSTVYREVGRALYRGQSPYTVPGFLNPPWTALVMLPFAWLPEAIGRAAFMLVSLAAFMIVPIKLKARPVTLLLFLLSPPVLHCLLNASIDWLVLLGFILPPQIGLFFVLIKPQAGIAVALFWLVEAWRKGGVRQVWHDFWPVTAALLASFVLFGLWPIRFETQVDLWWNASLWPASIPVGLALIVTSIRQRKVEYAMAASPCLSPYVLLHSWSAALVALARAPWEMLASVVGLWVLVLMQAA